MDRKAIIILLVSAALLVSWRFVTKRIYPDIPAPPPKSNVVAKATSAPNAQAQSPTLSANTNNSPSPITNLPSREERTLVLESPDARYVFTSHGGALKQIELKHFKAAV